MTTSIVGSPRWSAAWTGWKKERGRAEAARGRWAYVSADRIPEEGLGDRFWELAPDLAVDEVLEGDDVLPGLRLPIAELFERS